ncbi:MAG: LytTR family DNA-binding domain-containing protein [Eubacteriales bacterium]|nr:LytTR family DNA-binding domain-containing protein [Eubacteriales bacterium]
MQIAYLEDRPLDQEQMLILLRAWIEERSPQSAVTIFPDAESFLFALEDQHFDLYLFDILMPGQDGLSLAQELRAQGNESPIVFVTSEIDYVLAGYKVAATDYLLKPIEKAELFQVLDRVAKALSSNRPALVLDHVEGLETIFIDQILAVEAADKEVIYSLKTPKKSRQIRLRDSLQAVEERLADLGFGRQFQRIHRAVLVNLSFVQRIEQSTVLMQDGQTFPLARNRRREVMAQYLAYRKARAAERSGRASEAGKLGQPGGAK